MTTFRVWAPNAERVDLVLARRTAPMARAAGGWWSVPVPDAPQDAVYRFSVDGGDPRPDPRSHFQPHGVHGPSRLVDHAQFPWTDQHWQAPPLVSALIYELHTGTFTPEGTFEAAIDKLDYLKDLGVTHVELIPVAEFPGRRGWGYDGASLYAPHHAYGGPEGLKRLVDAAHSRGLAVLLDVVYNHLGPSGNYLGVYGPYFTARYSTPWGEAINYDGANSDEVRRFFIDNALMWLRDYHFDGLRLDAVHAILDTSAYHVLEQLADEVRELGAQLGRHFVLIAESDLNDPRYVRSSEVGGYGLDAQWSDDFHHALHSVLTGEQTGYYRAFGGLDKLATALRRAFVYAGEYSPHKRRRHGRPPVGLSGHRFLGFIQNHDQIGNRARGERVGHLASPGRVKIAAALVLTAPFVPMLFQGEEWAAASPFQYFTDHDDAELGRLVTAGRRKEFASFGWDPNEVPDPQSPEPFHVSRLNWSELDDPQHAEIQDWHKRLIRLRREAPALTSGRLDQVNVRFDEAAGWLVMQRGPLRVACNLGTSVQRVRLGLGDRVQLLLASDDAIELRGDTLTLPPDTVAILREGEAE